jgi:tetratricopeptide (TPR) repeat protein
METIKFIFWEAMKVLGLVFVGLLAVKTVANMKYRVGWLRWLKGALYALISGLTLLGARTVGYDVAAQVYLSASQDELTHAQYSRAYDNALRAVQLRPGSLRCWRALALTKIYLRQFASLLDDMPAFQSLAGGKLDEEDAYRFALCYFYLADYDKVLPLTRKLISQNRFYAAPYVLEGLAYTAQKKYRDAELTFLDVLQMFPTHEAAVEGLAHAYFLDGNRAGAITVLNLTSKHAFPSDARQRFEALKALYAQ